MEPKAVIFGGRVFSDEADSPVHNIQMNDERREILYQLQRYRIKTFVISDRITLPTTVTVKNFGGLISSIIFLDDEEVGIPEILAEHDLSVENVLFVSDIARELRSAGYAGIKHKLAIIDRFDSVSILRWVWGVYLCKSLQDVVAVAHTLFFS